MAYINGTRIMSAQLNGLVAIDEELSADSTNPVQNKAVGNTLANAVKGTVTGIGAVRMDDVSPVEHELDVKVTSKNLLDSNLFLAATNWTETDGVYSGYIQYLDGIFHHNHGGFLPNFPFKENTQYSFSFKARCNGILGKEGIIFRFVYTDGTRSELRLKHSETFAEYSMTSTIGKTVDTISCTYADNCVLSITQAQLEEGTTATPFTPYIADFSDVTVTGCGKNLFRLTGREVVNFGAFGNTTQRTFPGGNGIILGFSRNNYCHNKMTQPYTIIDNSVSYEVVDGWYGIGFDVKLLPNTTYFVSCSEKTGSVFMTEYDADGNYIQAYGLLDTQITTSSTAAWGVISSTDGAGVVVGFSDLQLELGTTATPYEPYVEPTEHTANADGTVPGVMSASPTTTLTADTDGVILAATYNKDTNGVINTLVERLAALEAAVINS